MAFLSEDANIPTEIKQLKNKAQPHPIKIGHIVGLQNNVPLLLVPEFHYCHSFSLIQYQMSTNLS